MEKLIRLDLTTNQSCPSPKFLFQFSSRYAKSGNNYVIFQVINPTKNFVTLVEKDAGPDKKFPDTIRSVSTRVAPYVSHVTPLSCDKSFSKTYSCNNFQTYYFQLFF